MQEIYLRNHNEKLSMNNGKIIQSCGGDILASYPICAIDAIQIYSNAQLTTQVIKECLKEGVTINYFNSYGKHLGKIESEYPKNTMRRLQQYKLYWDSNLRLAWAKQLIKAKIQGEIIELRRLTECETKFPHKAIRKELKKYLSCVDNVKDIQHLLGIEGMCSRKYYEIFQYVLPIGIKWNNRKYHPAPDGINALLSFVYAITANIIREKIQVALLDPHCSFLHEPGYNKGGLSYDILEIFRAIYCDNFVFKTLRKRKDIVEEILNLDTGYLSASTSNFIANEVRNSVNKRYYRQKYSIEEQIKEAVTNIVSALNNPAETPCFSNLLPER